MKVYKTKQDEQQEIEKFKLDTYPTKKVNFVNARCASGKSYKLKLKISNGYFKHYKGKVLVVVPSYVLMDEYLKDLRDVALHYIRYTANEQGVALKLKAALAPDFHLKYIVITHECLTRYCVEAALDDSFKELLSDCKIFVDELPEGYFGGDFKVNESNSIDDNYVIFDWLTQSPDNPNFYYLNSGHYDSLLKFYREGHTSSDTFKEIIWIVLQGYPLYKHVTEKGKVFFAAKCVSPLILASQWADEFTLLGASVDKSEIVYRARRELEIPVNRADSEHWPDADRNDFKHTHNINVRYVLSGDASLTRLCPIYTDALMHVKRALRENYLIATNNDSKERPKKRPTDFPYRKFAEKMLPEAEFAPMKIMGVNKYCGNKTNNYSKEDLMMMGVNNVEGAYEGFSKIAFLGVVNDNPMSEQIDRQYATFLGYDYEELKRVRFHEQNSEVCMQFLCRGTIRSENYTGPLEFIVPSEDTALYLKENYFPDCTISALGVRDPDPKPKNTTVVKKVDRDRAIIEPLHDKGMTRQQIIKETGLSESTVKRRIREIKAERSAA